MFYKLIGRPSVFKSPFAIYSLIAMFMNWWLYFMVRKTAREGLESYELDLSSCFTFQHALFGRTTLFLSFSTAVRGGDGTGARHLRES